MGVDSLEILSFRAANSRVKICVYLTLVGLERNANLEMIGRVVIDLCVLVLLDSVEILSFLVPEVNVKTIVNVEAIKPVSTSLAKTHAKTLVESTLNAKHSIMVPSVLVPMDTSVTRLQLAELPETPAHLSNKGLPTPESSAFPDSSAPLITLLVSSFKHTGTNTKIQ